MVIIYIYSSLIYNIMHDNIEIKDRIAGMLVEKPQKSALSEQSEYAFPLDETNGYVYIFVSNKLCNVCDILPVTLTKIFFNIVLNESYSIKVF